MHFWLKFHASIARLQCDIMQMPEQAPISDIDHSFQLVRSLV